MYFRKKYAKTNQLRATYVKNKEDGSDIFYSHDGGCNTDMRVVDNVFTSPRYSFNGHHDPSFLVELIDRGYDITTLDFKIDRLDMNDTLRVNINQNLRRELSKKV